MQWCAICSVFALVSATLSSPVSQPLYPSAQFVTAQNLPAQFQQQQPNYKLQQQQQQQQQSFLQQLSAQTQYLTPQTQQQVTPIFEGARRAQLQFQQQQQQQPQPIQQVLLPSAVDRQIQRVANQVAGPQYAQQVQFAQQQAQAQDALATAQRKATSQTYRNRPIQPVPVPQPQYLRELTQPQPQPQPRPYARPVPIQSYRPQQQQQPQQQRQQQQEPEEYDPNPSYQFGFDVKDDLYTNYQNRNEQRDGDKISGSYSVVDSDGFIRTVKYTADPKEGFKAEVTRQPTDIVVKIPKPLPQYQQRQEQQQPQYNQALQAGPGPQGQKQNVIYQYQ